ncbi:hypothetical protein [Amycolatopsis sp. NPDC098790]|uniref:hypothetical protein n=1 Tax=Amycolatopsis sp. NPDC098790 TaxID=3363939 RepID=UPI00381FDF58
MNVLSAYLRMPYELLAEDDRRAKPSSARCRSAAARTSRASFADEAYLPGSTSVVTARFVELDGVPYTPPEWKPRPAYEDFD